MPACEDVPAHDNGKISANANSGLRRPKKTVSYVGQHSSQSSLAGILVFS